MKAAIDWQAIVLEHGPLVWRTARRILGNDADAADCYQETFIAVHAAARRDEVRSWPALLHRISTARSLDRLRQRIRDRGRTMDGAVPDEAMSSGPDPHAELEARELAEILRRVLVRLPSRESTVFCLREIGGMSYAEIGSTLGISENAAGVAAHRARRKLATMLCDLHPASSVPRPNPRTVGERREND